MKIKQLIERNLKFTNTYVYLGLTRGSIESGKLTSCDNCGKLITNMVQIADNKTGQRYTIGTDCSDTLVKANCVANGVNRDYHLDIYTLNQLNKFVCEVNKGKVIKDNGFLLSITNDKGKELTAFRHNLEQYYPEVLI
jgi:formate dehydrogenase maturation protein FdhE